MSLRILHINWQIWPAFKGGHVVHVHNLIEALSNFDTTQAYLYTANGKDGTQIRVKKKMDNDKTFYEIMNNPNHPFKTLPQTDLEFAPVEDATCEVIEEFKPDIVHIHHLIQLPISIINVIKVKFELPIVITIRDYWYICPFYSLSNYKKQICDPKRYDNNCSKCFHIKNKIDKTLTEHYAWDIEFSKRKEVMIREINRADLITFVSDYLRKQYVDLGITPEISEVITSGVPFREMIKKTRVKGSASKNLAFLGFASYIKGTYFLLESFRDWDGPQVNIHFFGPLEDKSLFSEVAENLLNVNIIRHGPYERKDLQELLRDIDVGIVPSLWPDTAPQVIFDFFACGIPVIASEIGGIPEFVKNEYNGLLFELGNKEHFLRQLKKILNNESLLDTLTMNVRLTKPSHDYADELYTRYLQILNSKETKVSKAIELGGGETPHKKKEGFLNVDMRKIPEVDIVSDIKKLPFDSNSINHIYCSNVAEHFKRIQVRSVFIEWWRVLERIGLIDIVVPDLENVLDSWRQIPYNRVLDALYGAQKFAGDFHFNGFTEITLKNALKDAGFNYFPLVKKYIFDNVPRLWVRAQKKVKLSFYPLGDHTIASSRVRILMIYPFLAKKGYDIELFGEIEKAEVVILQKRFDPYLLRSNILTILDIDDNYFEHGHQKSEVQKAASQVYAVVVSTSRLAKLAKKYNKNVFVIPTGIDSHYDSWKHPNQKKNISKVAWVGYPENIVYLNKLMPLLKKYKYTLCLITRNTPDVGDFMLRHREFVEFYEWDIETVDHYLENCDLGIAPLGSDSWSQSKSAYKIFKYWAIGLPVICDFSPENRKIEEEFGIDCVARNLNEWADKLTWSKSKRMAQVLKAQKQLSKYSPEKTADRWDSVIDQLIRKFNSDKPSVEMDRSFNDSLPSFGNADLEATGRALIQPEGSTIRAIEEVKSKDIKSLAADESPDEQIATLEKMLKTNPDDKSVLNMLAELHLKKGDKEKALHNYEKIVEIAPDDTKALKTLADVYKNGFARLSDAYNIYMKIHNNSPYDTEVLQEIEHLLELLGRSGDAKMLFPQIKQIREESLPLKSDNTISINIESIEQRKRYLEISGWAFINGEDSMNSKISIILKSEKNCFVAETSPVKRPDVTSFFHTQNYDDSGFFALIPNIGLEDGEYKIIVFIKKGSVKAYHETDEKIVIKNGSFVREPKEAEPIHPKCSDEDTKSLESKSIHKQEEDEYVQEIEKIFSTFSTGAIENKSLKSLLGELSDDFWFWLFTAGYENDILKRIFPKMPDPDIQVQYTGRSGYLALEQAFSAYKLFKRILREHSKDINFCDKVLDFGCGWGRIIRFFLKDVEASGLYGVDCFKGIIDLCKTQNLRCNFEVVNAMPPTHFDSDTFDLIYLYSVFSHLSEKAHLEWLNEFRRIMKPTGMLIATTRPRSFIKLCADLRRQKDLASWQRGAAASFKDPEKALVDYDSGKFVHSPTSGSGVLNDSFYGESCIPKKYVEENWIKYFSQIGYIYVEEHKSFDQDVIFAKK